MYNAIVTGASSGIGEALYKKLKASKKWNVLGISRGGPDIKMDLAKANFFHLKDPAKMFEKVDLLINCAGVMLFDPSQKQERYMFDLNFWGSYNLITVLLPNFNKGACIINIASVSGMKADPDTVIYGASKAAVISLTKSLAKAYAPDIRVNCISPGFYKTNLVPGAEVPQDLIDTIPLGYADDPINLYQVVKMIWKTKYMTGANIVVDGGVSL